MKTRLIACLIVGICFKTTSAQFFITAQATDLVLLEDLSLTPNSTTIGLTNKIGYYDFFRDIDQYIETSIYIPKNNEYKSIYFKDETFYPDSITISEKVKYFTIGYSVRYLFAADSWDYLLLGVSGGAQFGFESVTQEATDKGLTKSNDFKSRSLGGIWGISGLYLLNDEIAISADMAYKMPYLPLGDDTYYDSYTQPAARQGLQISIGILMYFE